MALEKWRKWILTLNLVLQISIASKDASARASMFHEALKGCAIFRRNKSSPLYLDRVEQFLMDSAETAVRHDHHDVTLAQIGRDVFDYRVGAFYREGLFARRAQVGDYFFDRQLFVGGQPERFERRRDHHIIGGGESRQVILLKDFFARGPGAWLEDSHD